MKHKRMAVWVSCLIFSLFVVGCRESQKFLPHDGKAQLELPSAIQSAMKAEDMTKNSPIFLRVFKEESQLEVWKQRRNGTYGLIATYDICKWSGKLGPKYVEGDRQAPEGFYSVRPAQMKPNSQYYLAFDIGFPNAYDRINGRTGQHLMVHGACSSAGCYSMTDENIVQIYAFGRDSFAGGQQEFHVHAFPFRMTSANMQRYKNDPNYPFWSMLKEGYDLFEAQKIPPRVDVCEKRYVFNRTTAGQAPLMAGAQCPAPPAGSLTSSYAAEQSKKLALPAIIKGIGSKDKAPAPSIQGVTEAHLVADWSRRRARGEKVSATPPSLTTGMTTNMNSLANNSAMNNHTKAVVGDTPKPQPKPQIAQFEKSSDELDSKPQEGFIKKKKGWSLFGRK